MVGFPEIIPGVEMVQEEVAPDVTYYLLRERSDLGWTAVQWSEHWREVTQIAGLLTSLLTPWSLLRLWTYFSRYLRQGIGALPRNPP